MRVTPARPSVMNIHSERCGDGDKYGTATVPYMESREPSETWRNGPDSAILENAVGIFASEFRPDMILLYGPSARGAVPDGQAGMLVLIEGDDPDMTGELIRRRLREIGLRCRPLVVDGALYRICLEKPYTEEGQAIRDGVVVYGRVPDGPMRLDVLRYGTDSLRLDVPLEAVLERTDDGFCMSCDELEICGWGRTYQEAYADLSGAFMSGYELFGREDDEQATAFRRHVGEQCIRHAVPNGCFRPFEKGRVVRDSGFIDDAVIEIAEMYGPKRIIVYGPAAAGYVDGDRTFDMMVILDDIGTGDAKALEREMRNHLVREMRLNGHVLVMSESDFEEDARIVGTAANDAVTTGYVAYES